ncbi:multidrug effflux MFS transporter [Ramlibacter sp.]|uniref:multidrug effflux MFS transporter n=1 Tax=Ramlibacter sp. TaxID=1917967 RepID=UPI002D561669|nr:multidrug effflux MFS transporter [Ramlibacter sp.]HYD77969.1 multidrug effflux MFS transporter [Ramlibacter sp.]
MDAPRRHPLLTMANLVAQLAFGLLGMTICLPSMPDWTGEFQASQAAVQLTFSGFVAAYGGMQLVYGPLSDRIGRKPVLLIGLSVALVGLLVAAAAPNLATLTLGRVLQGAGSAAGMVTGRALVQDLFDGSERTRVMAFIGMAMGVVPPLSTLLGGQLHVHVGWQANFVLMAVLALVLMVAAWRGLPDRPASQATAPGGGLRQLVGGYLQLVRQPAFVLYVAMLASTTATFYTFLGGTPLVLKGYGVAPEHLGWYIGVIPIAYVFGNMLTMRLAQRRGDAYIVARGQALTLAGLLIVVALGLADVRHPLALALPLLLLGVGHGLMVPPTLIGTVGLVPALAGSAAAMAGVMQQLLGALGGFVVSLVPNEGQTDLGLIMLGWAVMGLAAQLVLYGRVLKRR